MMIDIIEKSKELLFKLEALENVDEKRKKKYIKCLNKIISGEGFIGDPSLYLTNNSDCYASAFFFVQENGQETFEQLKMSTSNGQLISLFKKHQMSFTDEEYWMNLRETYIMQDYEQLNIKALKKLFLSKRKFNEKLMEPDEYNYLKSLPDFITIYRGGSIDEPEKGFGISWSLNKQIAEKFAKNKSIHTGCEMVVFEKTIYRDLVLAYINSRQEEEIIYLHK
jgi:hypothetical protein